MRKHKILGIMLGMFLLIMESAACAANQVPIANAGVDQFVTKGQTVYLDGSLSSDADGSIVKYRWQQKAGTRVRLSNAKAAQTSFAIPAKLNKDDILVFELTVTDNEGAEAKDSVSINVKFGENAPITNAGADQTVNEKTKVKLDGSLSYDTNGSITRYSWVQTGGLTVDLNDTAAAAPEFIAPDVDQITELLFKLTVTDNVGLSTQDQVVITVSDNQPPTVLQLIGVSSLSGEELTAEWLLGDDDKTTHANLIYTLHVSESQGFTPSAATAKYTQNGIASATVNGLIPGTVYFVKAVAIDEGGLESWSNELNITTANVIAERSLAPVLVQGALQDPQITEDTISFSNGPAPNIGEYIASAEAGGYLRKVMGVQTQNNQVIIDTLPASLNEVRRSG
jgi:hypothetical protein